MEAINTMKTKHRKIAILGPESTGKSTLAAALAHHFNTLWVPEFARVYLEGLNRPYDYADVLQCARGQRAWEEQQLCKTSGPIFFDTEMINLHIWLKEKFGNSPDWILENIRNRYDFYLLTEPDLPFVADPLRENPDRRSYFFEIYQQEILKFNIPFAIVNGHGKNRLLCALEYL